LKDVSFTTEAQKKRFLKRKGRQAAKRKAIFSIKILSFAPFAPFALKILFLLSFVPLW